MISSIFRQIISIFSPALRSRLGHLEVVLGCISGGIKLEVVLGCISGGIKRMKKAECMLLFVAIFRSNYIGFLSEHH